MTLSRHQFLWLATAFEGSLVLIAYFLGHWLLIDPLGHFHLNLNAIILGLIGCLPLYGLFVLSYRLEVARDIRNFLIEKLGGLLAGCTGFELLYLGLLAGVTEEILFRGLLQPWLEQDWGWLGGLIFSNMIFALLHWITPLYALLAGICGVYLGLTLDIGPERNLLTPILVHALYDFLAFMYLKNTVLSRHASN